MAINFLKRSDKHDHDDVQDPRPKRLDKRTLIILALGLAAIVIALITASNSGGRGKAVQNTDPADDAGYIGVFSGSGSGILTGVDNTTPPPAPAPVDMGSPWAAGLQTNLIPGDDEDPRVTDYKAALKGGGILFSSGAAPAAQAASSQPEDELAGRILTAGSVIEAVLETAINTDRPGPVSARVVADVRDSQEMTEVVIPAGTRVLGRVAGVMGAAGAAVDIGWDRLVFPDGRTVDLQNLPSLDPSGAGGLAGQVDRHRTARYGRAALQAVIGGSAALAASQLAGGLNGFGGFVGLQVAQQASGTLMKNGRPPTISLDTGHLFLIYVNQDIPI